MPHHQCFASNGFRIVLLLVLAAGVPAAAQAEQRARLSIDLKVFGTEYVRGSGQSREHAEGRFEERYEWSVTLDSSGEPTSINTKDPAYFEKMMSLSAAPASGGRYEEEAERYLDFLCG